MSEEFHLLAVGNGGERRAGSTEWNWRWHFVLVLHSMGSFSLHLSCLVLTLLSTLSAIARIPIIRPTHAHSPPATA